LKSSRRIGAATSKTRAVLLDVTEQLMLEQGYAAVSSRRVAAKAGVKAPLVHYYFPTLDDLFIAIFRRRTERFLEQLSRALDSDQPLRTVWEFNNDPRGAALTMEFVALANHRKAIGAEIAHAGERIRTLQADAIAAGLSRRGIDADSFPALAFAVFMSSIPRHIVLEGTHGLTLGHPEAIAFVERWLDEMEGPSRRGSTSAADAPGPDEVNGC